jgi:hypothetical protein
VTYRGGEAKTDAKDVRVIADQSRMRGGDLPVFLIRDNRTWQPDSPPNATAAA